MRQSNSSSVVLMLMLILSTIHGESVQLSTIEEQQTHLDRARAKCVKEMNESAIVHEKKMCPRFFDKIACWPPTNAGELAVLKCPDYFHGFNTEENASRWCAEDGQWYGKPKDNATEGIYTKCLAGFTQRITPELEPTISPEVKAHLPRIEMLQTVGYCVSVLSLIIALIIMITLRRLHCPRNTIHMNLFASFILRGIFHLLVQFKVGQNSGTNEQDILNIYVTDWPCKLLSSVWMYTRLSNCVWITLEGFYLHMLIYLTTFSERSGITPLILAGWGGPALFVLPWIMLRIFDDDFDCWIGYTNSKRMYRWIIEAPIVLLIVVNAIFFVIIIRLLFTKLRASESGGRETTIYRYIKLARSTLVLIPLFGVHYVVFLFVQFHNASGTLEVVRFYFDAFWTSFQGLMVGVLFCFFNGEVRLEIFKIYKRWKLLQTMQINRTQLSMSTMFSNQRQTSLFSSADSISPNHSRHSSNQSAIIRQGSGVPRVTPEEFARLLHSSEKDNNMNNVKTSDSPM